MSAYTEARGAGTTSTVALAALPTLDGVHPVWRDDVTHSGAGRSGFAYQPALDGVRGLSVLLVLLFHGGWSWMRGGYVGVSVFFTLSGFLITRLLLREHEERGRINVVSFWGRRMRRLLPASMVCLLGVAILGSIGMFGETPDLGRELIGALTHVANWVQLTGEVSYSEQVLGHRSPLDHYWSLAIEEQFYWVWPLVMVAVLRRSRPDRVIVRLAFVSVAAAPLIGWAWGSDVAYWATPARIGEILVGAALAATMERHRSLRFEGRGRRLTPLLGLLGVPALGVIVWAAVRWPSDGGPADRGLMPVFAFASAALILALQVRSPLRRAFSLRPLVALGAISYGVYLYHWPIFLVLDDRVPGGRFATFAVQMVVTLAVAAVSYRLLEHPIRRTSGGSLQLTARFALAAAAVLAVAWVGAFGRPDRFDDPTAAASQLEPVAELEPLTPLKPTQVSPQDDPGQGAAREPSIAVTDTVGGDTVGGDAVPVVPDESVAVTPARPVRILVIGDSTGWSVGDGLAAWAAANPELASVSLTVSPGCGFILEGRVPEDDGAGYAEQCSTVLNEWMMTAIRDLKPDIALLMSTRTDVKDREWTAEEGVLSNLDERFQVHQRSDYGDITDWILGTGVPQVVWVKPPVVRPDPAPVSEMTDPERIAVLHRIIAETVAGSDPARVTSIDLAAWYATSGLDDGASRLDGMHFEVGAATTIAERFVGPRLVNVAVGAAGSTG